MPRHRFVARVFQEGWSFCVRDPSSRRRRRLRACPKTTCSSSL